MLIYRDNAAPHHPKQETYLSDDIMKKAREEQIQKPGNVFSIKRKDLLVSYFQQQKELFFPSSNSAPERRHDMPVSMMGNFNEYLSKKQKLRPLIEEPAGKRQKTAFGNPFVLAKTNSPAVDEADVDAMNTNTSSRPSTTESEKQEAPTKNDSVQVTKVKQETVVDPFVQYKEDCKIRNELWKMIRDTSFDVKVVEELVKRLSGPQTRKVFLEELIEQSMVFNHVQFKQLLMETP